MFKDLPGNSTNTDQVAQGQILKDQEQIVDLLNAEFAGELRMDTLCPEKLQFSNALVCAHAAA